VHRILQPVNYTTFSRKGVTVPCKDDTIFKETNPMLLENIQFLSLHDLLDLLVKNTTQLLNTMRQKGADITEIRDLRMDVQLIQSAISKKKSENSFSSIM